MFKTDQKFVHVVKTGQVHPWDESIRLHNMNGKRVIGLAEAIPLINAQRKASGKEPLKFDEIEKKSTAPKAKAKSDKPKMMVDTDKLDPPAKTDE